MHRALLLSERALSAQFPVPKSTLQPDIGIILDSPADSDQRAEIARQDGS